MDIQKPLNTLAQNMMNLEPLENQSVRCINAMQIEETAQFDTFDLANMHNPQMVSVYAKQIFEYLREKEVMTALI
jgi:hypothetical protein